MPKKTKTASQSSNMGVNLAFSVEELHGVGWTKCSSQTSKCGIAAAVFTSHYSH